MNNLAKNSIYNIIHKCISLIVPLVTTFYVSRILLSDGVGKVVGAQNIVTYFILLASLGIPTYGIKKTAEYSDDLQGQSQTFKELFVLNAISTFICSIAYILFIFSFDYFDDKIALSLVVGIQLFSNLFNLEWFFQGIENFKLLAISDSLVKLAGISLIFLFVKTKDDILQYALISVICSVASYYVLLFPLKKRLLKTNNKLNIRQHLKPVLVLFCTTIAIEIYTLVDVTMLNFMQGDKVVACYSSAVKIISIVRMLVASVCAAFFPKLSYFYIKNKDEFWSLAKKGIKILVTLSIPAAVGVILLSDNLVNVFLDTSFADTSTDLQILALSVVTVAISNFIGYQILVTMGKEKTVLLSTIYGAIINVVLNCFLINLFSQIGAAIASVITELLVTIYQLLIIRKNHKGLISSKYLITVLIPVIVMTISVLMIKVFVGNNILQLILGTVVGFTVFCIGSVLMKNEVISEAVQLLKSKFIK